MNRTELTIHDTHQFIALTLNNRHTRETEDKIWWLLFHRPTDHLRRRPSEYCERGTTSANGVDNGVGSGELRQTGHVALSFNQASTQVKWKQCLQSGNILIISTSLYSHKQIAHTESIAFGIPRENGNLGYELITDWSSPTTTFWSSLLSSSTKIILGTMTPLSEPPPLGFRICRRWLWRWRKQM